MRHFRTLGSLQKADLEIGASATIIDRKGPSEGRLLEVIARGRYALASRPIMAS